jgi:hypothetical protein
VKSDPAVQAVLRGRLVRRNDPSEKIAGTLERLAGVALVGEGALDSLGGIASDYAGETMVWWDEQRTAERRGQGVFVDEAGHEVLEEAVVILLDDGRILDPCSGRSSNRL